MVKKAKKPDDIESLLQEKRQVQQWLDRLDMAADKTPAGVRTKVRGDYQKRLDDILEQLAGYTDEIKASLEEQRGRRTELADQESEQSERLAEAELRHTVGEYDEGKWSEIKTEILEGLVKVRQDLKSAGDEIQRLEEVLASIEESESESTEPEVEPKAEEPKAEEIEEEEEEEEEELTVPDVDVEDVESVADEEIPEPEETDEEAAAAGRGSQQTDAFDELAFLRSVTEDEKHGPRADRASGVHVAADFVPADSKKGEATRSVGAEGVEADEGQKTQPTKGTAKKTVKCGECGAMNLPTEWYCERCGAELAAL